MKTLETERLILRAWKTTDANDLYEYAKNEAVGPFAGWKPHGSILESEEILKMFQNNDDVYAIEHKETGKVIGSLGLHLRKPDEALEHLEQREIGYVLNPAYWGKGYVPEAVFRVLKYCFEEMNLDLVWCGHFDFNDKSKRVNEKCGFSYKFTKDEKARLLGNLGVRTLYYAMTKEAYANKKIKVAFIDRDGTIGGDNTVIYPGMFKLFPFTEESLEALKKHGFKLFSFTNQPGISRGECTKASFEKELFEFGFDQAYICPHTDEEKCECRKPSPKMLIEASKEHGFSLSECVVIGDRWSDMLAADAVGAMKILVMTGAGSEAMGEQRKKWEKVEPDYVAADLKAAVSWLLSPKE